MNKITDLLDFKKYWVGRAKKLKNIEDEDKRYQAYRSHGVEMMQ